MYSQKLQRFYIGTTDSFEKRLDQHNSIVHPHAFTRNGIPWEVHIVIEGLSSRQAYSIEAHIKKMKSQQFVKNLAKYPEMIEKLKSRYL